MTLPGGFTLQRKKQIWLWTARKRGSNKTVNLQSYPLRSTLSYDITTTTNIMQTQTYNIHRSFLFITIFIRYTPCIHSIPGGATSLQLFHHHPWRGLVCSEAFLLAYVVRTISIHQLLRHNYRQLQGDKGSLHERAQIPWPR